MGQEIDEFTTFIGSEGTFFFCCLNISLFSIFLMLLYSVFLTFFFLLSCFSTFFLPLSLHLHDRLQLPPPFFSYLPPHQPSRDSVCLSYLFYLLLSTWSNHCFARLPSFAISCYGNRQSVGPGDTMPSQNWQEETVSSICGG